MTIEDDLDIPNSGAVFTFGKSRFADNAPSKFWIKNDQITQVSCGDEHTAVLTETGRVFMIGSNDLGQLGLDSFKPVVKPSCVKALKPHRIVSVACGRAHTLAASADGSVYSWGHNQWGQLGTGDTESKACPSHILSHPPGVRGLSAGSKHSALVTDEGQVLVWGSNSCGQLGLEDCKEGALTPTHLPLDEPIVGVACGYYHTIALSVRGIVIAWGECVDGQLGVPLTQYPLHTIPHSIRNLPLITKVAAGSRHSLFLTDTGQILSCGKGESGQLGQGKAVVHSIDPVALDLPSDVTFSDISAGDTHSAALSSVGQVYSWGCGRHGKLGLGENNTTSQFSPTPLTRLRHLTAALVGCGGCHSMVLGYPSSTVDAAVIHRMNNSQMLPPLRSTSSSLPPLRHTVSAAPHTPDIPDQLLSGIDGDHSAAEKDMREILTVSGADQNEEEKDEKEGGSGDEEKEDTEEEKEEGDDNGDLEVKEKKGSAFKRLFRWGKKSSIEIINEESPEEGVKIEENEDMQKDSLPRIVEKEQLEDIGSEGEEETQEEKKEAEEEEEENGGKEEAEEGEDEAQGEEMAEEANAETQTTDNRGLFQRLRSIHKVNNMTEGTLEEMSPPMEEDVVSGGSEGASPIVPTEITTVEVNKVIGLFLSKEKE